jgi:hypothetical protein
MAAPPRDMAAAATRDMAPFIAVAHAPLIQIPDQGGPRLANPSLVTVTWPGDPLVDALRAFGAWIPQSQYWNMLSEYGVSTGTQAASVELSGAAPASLDAAQIITLLRTGIASGLVPPPVPNRLYVVYGPPATTITNGTYVGCQQFVGFHDSTPPGTDPVLVYAIVPRCPTPGMTDLAVTTWTASHEIAEAATDPRDDLPAWTTKPTDLRTPHGGEIGDLCLGFPLTGADRDRALFEPGRSRRQAAMPSC